MVDEHWEAGRGVDSGVRFAMDVIKEEPTVEEEVSHEEEEGETRCVCGEIDPPDDSGLYIQCENCSVWQHGSCVGIADGEDSHVEKYWCEQCKPELHHLYTVDTSGATRSIYRPVAERRRLSRRSNRHVESESDAPELGKKSEDEATVGSSSSSGRSRGSRGRKSEAASVDEEGVDGGRLDPGVVRSDRGVGAEHEQRPDGPVGVEDGDRRLQDRKRATFSAREEKQYQWMLEKAIRESRRTSQQEDEPGIPADSAGDEAHLLDGEPATQLTADDGSVEHEGVVHGPDDTPAGADSASAAIPATAASASPVPERPAPLSVSRSSNSTSEEDTKRRPASRRSQRAGKTSKKVSKNTADSTPRAKGNASKAEIGINKPMKPRIPPQRTSLNEMRRRVTAILEFISRTQWELSESHSSKEELVRFVENEQFVDQVDSIFEKYDHSFKLMDDLTRSLLLWEKKYSGTVGTQD